MNKEKCQNAVQYIRPSEDFTQRTMAYLRQEKDKARRRIRHTGIAAGALAAAACAAVALFAFPGLLRPAPEAPSGSVAVSTPSTIASASASTETQRLVLDGNPVAYSSLKFGYTGSVQYPDVPDQTAQMCVIAFSEEMLSRSALVARVTVEDVRFNDYFTYTHTALYTLRIERIFYTSLDVTEGDSFTVEQILYGGCLSDSEFGLKPGGCYILPISADEGIIAEYDIDNEPHIAAKESPYSLVYPFQPMIELTEDGGYLFFGDRDVNGGGFGWRSLVSEDTVEVVMDVETASGAESWISRMKLRADTGFEDDFQVLVNYYCMEGGTEPGNLETVPHGSEITGLEALAFGEAVVPEGWDISSESCWFDVIHKQWNVHFEFADTQSVYDIRLSPTGALIGAEWS